MSKKKLAKGIVGGKPAPKPKYKADRRLSSSVESRLKEQESVKRNAPAPKTTGGPAFKQTPTERAADKAKKSDDTRVKSAGENLTAAQRKRINAAPTPQALTSLQSTMVKEIDALKSLSDAEKKTRKANLKGAIENRKDTLRERAKTPAKKPKPKNPDEVKQSAKERARAGFGNVRSIGTTQRNKKEGPGSMVSYTSMTRAAGKAKAKRDLDAGRITKAEYDRIIKAIDRANEREVSKAGRGVSQRAADMKSKTPTTRKAPFPIPANDKGNKDLNNKQGGYTRGKKSWVSQVN